MVGLRLLRWENQENIIQQCLLKSSSIACHLQGTFFGTMIGGKLFLGMQTLLTGNINDFSCKSNNRKKNILSYFTVIVQKAPSYVSIYVRECLPSIVVLCTLKKIKHIIPHL